MRTVLAIPTIDVATAERCVSSFYRSLGATQTTAIVIYNGRDRDIESRPITDRGLLIGSRDSDDLAQAFASLAGCAQELLFGDPNYGRSYGGASNLAVAVAIACGAQRIAKVDDDCLDTENGWLNQALHFATDTTAVHFGHSTGRQSGFIDQLPFDTAVRLASHFYTPEELAERLGTGTHGHAIKNGILSFASSIARLACYPVMFEPTTGISLRGEAYLWKDALSHFRISFLHHDGMGLAHHPTRKSDVASWLYSTVLGVDLWFVLRCRTNTESLPSIAQRKLAIREFCDWIAHAVWPAEVDVDRLLELAGNESMLISLTDRIFQEAGARLICWRRLMSANPNHLVRRILPQLTELTEDGA